MSKYNGPKDDTAKASATDSASINTSIESSSAKPTNHDVFPIVGIGASAGGLEA